MKGTSNNTTGISRKNSCAALSSDGATMAKVIATFCVVLVHSYKLFKFMNVDASKIVYLNGFHAFGICSLPIFFGLAGYYLVVKDHWDYRNNLKKKIRSLVIPFLGFIAIYAVISCVGSLIFPAFFDDFRKFTAQDWLMHLIGIPFLKDPIFYGPLWFVRDLMILNILSFALVPIVKKVPGYLLIPLMAALYFAPIDRQICNSIPFFVTGMYFGFKKKIPILNNPNQIAAVAIAAFAVPIVFESEIALEISILLFAISTLAISEKLIKNEKIKKMAKKAIPFSLPVYMLHEYPMTTITRLLALQHISTPFAVAAYFVLPIPVIALCTGAAVLWKRVLPKTYMLLTGGRFKQESDQGRGLFGGIIMSEAKKGKRIQYIDILKALAIILVVIAHIDAKVAKPWISPFVMSAFFFASGMLLKTTPGTVKTELAFCKKRFLSLMIPYFIWALVYTAIYALTNKSFEAKRLLYILYGSHQSLGNAHTLTSLWCIPPLFLAMVLFSLCRLTFKDKLNVPVKLILAAVFLAVGGILPKLSKGYPWGVNLVPTAFGFIMLGNALFPSLERMRQKLEGRRGLAILIAGTVICFAGTFLYRFNIPGNGYINMANAIYGNYFLFLLVAFIGTAFMVFISLTLDRTLSEKSTAARRFFTFFGGSTMCTFATHKLFIRGFEALFNAVHVPYVVELIVTSVGTIAACFLAALLITRYLPILAGRVPDRSAKQQNKGQK